MRRTGARLAALIASAAPPIAMLVPLASGMAASACWREERNFRPVPVTSSVRGEQLSPLVPGPPSPPRAPSTHPYLSNAAALNQGKRLYTWFNCVGCHSHGGGGMGPALMDERWIYGSSPEQLYSSIAEGRPNGMPSFGMRLSPDQIWQLVAYVRAMSGRVPMDAAPGRSDELSTGEPENLREPPQPKGDLP